MHTFRHYVSRKCTHTQINNLRCLVVESVEVNRHVERFTVSHRQPTFRGFVNDAIADK